MKRRNTFADRGKFKEIITPILFKNENIVELILGDTSKMTVAQKRAAFKEHVKSHLFIDDTIEDAETFIFYDVIFPDIDTNVKDCRVIMYLICHRSIIDTYKKEGYYGNRADILGAFVEESLVLDNNIANEFGIGKLNLDSINLYNATKFYGCILTFNVPDFR